MSKYTHSFIMIHAFTMKPSDMIYYKNYLQRILSKDVNINYIYPKAPVRKITCYDGQKFTAWFDYLSELVENEDDEINKDHLLEQVDKIHKIIDKEKKRYKGDCSKIYLLGYSQGACMALDSGISYPEKLGGIIGFKGHINMDIDDYKRSKQDIWVTHSRGDDTIAFDVAKEYYDKYKKIGYNITLFEQGKKVNHDANSGIREQIKSLKFWLNGRIN